MLTMGFDGRWVNLIMQRVTSVSYSFLMVNGTASDGLIPARGLQKEDPLSPYLFILVADAFSYLIQNKVREGLLHGVKASRSGPAISCLLMTVYFLLEETDKNTK